MKEYQQLIGDSFALHKSLKPRLRLELLAKGVNPSVYRAAGYRIIGSDPYLTARRRKTANDAYSKVQDSTEVLKQETCSFDYSNAYSFLSPYFADLRPSQLQFFRQFPELVKQFGIGGEFVIQKETGSGKTALELMITQMLPKHQQCVIIVPTLTLGNQFLKIINQLYPAEKLSYVFSGKVDRIFQYGLNGRVIVMVEDSFTGLVNNNRIDLTGFHPALFILDESHLLQGPKFRNAFEEYAQKALTLSFTATPDRTFVKKPKGPAEPFLVGHVVHWQPLDKKPAGKIIYRDNPADLYRDKELCEIRWKSIETDLNFDDVAINRETLEYSDNSLNQKLAVDWNGIVDAFIKLKEEGLQDRRTTMVVCPNSTDLTVQAAHRYFNKVQETVAVVTSRETYVLYSGTSAQKVKMTREKVLDLYKSGFVKTVFQIRQLREGLDVPAIDCVAMMVPCNSVASYKQYIGRGGRYWIDSVTGVEKHLVVVDLVSTVAGQMNPLTAPLALGMVVQDEKGSLGFGKNNSSGEKPAVNEIRLNTKQSYLQDLYNNFLSSRAIYQQLIQDIKIINIKVGETNNEAFLDHNGQLLKNISRFKNLISPQLIRDGCIAGAKYYYTNNGFPIQALVNHSQSLTDSVDIQEVLNSAIAFNPYIYYGSGGEPGFLKTWLLETLNVKNQTLIQNALARAQAPEPQLVVSKVGLEPITVSSQYTSEVIITRMRDKYKRTTPYLVLIEVEKVLEQRSPDQMLALTESDYHQLIKSIEQKLELDPTRPALKAIKVQDNWLGLMYKDICQRLLSDRSFTEEFLRSETFELYFIRVMTRLAMVKLTQIPRIDLFKLISIGKLCEMQGGYSPLASSTVYNLLKNLQESIKDIDNPQLAIETYLDFELKAFDGQRITQLFEEQKENIKIASTIQLINDKLISLQIGFVPNPHWDKNFFKIYIEKVVDGKDIMNCFRTETKIKNQPQPATELSIVLFENSLVCYLNQSGLDMTLISASFANYLDQNLHKGHIRLWQPTLIMAHPKIRSIFDQQYELELGTTTILEQNISKAEAFKKLIEEITGELIFLKSDQHGLIRTKLIESSFNFTFYFGQIVTKCIQNLNNSCLVKGYPELNSIIETFFDKNKIQVPDRFKFARIITDLTSKKTLELSEVKELVCNLIMQWEVSKFIQPNAGFNQSHTKLIKKLKRNYKLFLSSSLYELWSRLEISQQKSIIEAFQAKSVASAESSQSIHEFRQFSDQVRTYLSAQVCHDLIDQSKLNQIIHNSYFANPGIQIETITKKVLTEFDKIRSGFRFLSQINSIQNPDSATVILDYLVLQSREKKTSYQGQFFPIAYSNNIIQPYRMFVIRNCYKYNLDYIQLELFKQIFGLYNFENSQIIEAARLLDPSLIIEDNGTIYLSIPKGQIIREQFLK